MWMSDQLSMFGEGISGGTGSVISLPGSGGGLTRSGSPVSLPIAKSGQGAVRVSRFRSRDSGLAMSTNDTSGQLFTVSSPSAGLQFALESRLRVRMGGSGYPLFALTWRALDMPSGPPLCQRQASARRTSATACSGWPTPAMADGIRGSTDARGHPTGRPLPEAAALCGPARLTASGQLLTGSTAGTASGGQLNPRFSLWLQGYPTAWASCGERVIRSSPRSRRSS
jgi:hypothetical protein